MIFEDLPLGWWVSGFGLVVLGWIFWFGCWILWCLIWLLEGVDCVVMQISAFDFGWGGLFSAVPGLFGFVCWL